MHLAGWRRAGLLPPSHPLLVCIICKTGPWVLVSFLWPQLGVAGLPLRAGVLGLSLSPEWEWPEQGHDSQEGVGMDLPPPPSCVWSGLGVGRLLPWDCCCLGHCPSPLTTEEVVDDGVGRAVGVHQPVGEGETGIHGFAVAGLVEHPEHPRAEGRAVRNGADVCMCSCS